MMERKKMIEAMIRGDLQTLSGMTKQKFIFLIMQESGNETFELRVMDFRNEKTETTIRAGKGDFRQALTPDERRYYDQSVKAQKVCAWRLLIEKN